jgi:hypothetical protein
MAQLRFVAGRDPCTVFGVTFEPGEWVETDSLDPDVVSRLADNPTFEFQADALPPPDPNLADPAAIKAALDQLGVEYHHNLGLEKLQALLAAATADD